MSESKIVRRSNRAVKPTTKARAMTEINASNETAYESDQTKVTTKQAPYTLEKSKLIDQKLSACNQSSDVVVSMVQGGLRLYFKAGAYVLFKHAVIKFCNMRQGLNSNNHDWFTFDISNINDASNIPVTTSIKVYTRITGKAQVHLNKKHISNKTKRHTNKDPGKTIYFPCSKKQSPDQTKSRAHQIMLRRERTAT